MRVLSVEDEPVELEHVEPGLRQATFRAFVPVRAPRAAAAGREASAA